ncbi:ligase-associated DNA damage response endonuclease PdeM [Methylocapsa aurea]|uniref:ligase-associated DNA damage response endonuclease PdeM n=1 Tax=Methylocapsa aurea TaxID=663610 RepID=UPI000561F4FF|nr:ligase-associated DNA damage response endonuclease PdeM [Methylocapsa aurea]
MFGAAPKLSRPPSMLRVADADFIADPAGALFWPEERLLIVADLHFEKGSAFAARGAFLPPYDTAATLKALARLIGAYQPRRVVALGDSFHDSLAGERLHPQDRAMIGSLQQGREWIWIAGNHDRDLPGGLEGDAQEELAIGAVIFRHEPRAGSSLGEIAGHLHPVAKVAGRAGSVRRRCFVSGGGRCVMPAFGAYAGGLNLCDPAFEPLFGGRDRLAHVMGRDEVYAVPHRRCAPD